MPDLDSEQTNSESEAQPPEKPGRCPGPRTEAGKARSSRNAIRHGCCSNTLILEGESREEFRQLLDSWMYDYNPTNSVLVELVRQVVIAQWLLIRKRGRYNQNEHRTEKEESNCLNWTEEHHKDMERFGRYMRQAERQFSNALANLERVRGRSFREGMQLQKAQERAAAIEMKRAAALDQERAAVIERERAAVIERERAATIEQERAAAFPAERKKPAAPPQATNSKEDPSQPPASATRSQTLFQGQNNPKKKRKIQLLEQWVEVTIEDGQTVTRLFPSNKNLIEHGKTLLPPPELVYRRLNFPHGVPPEYEWTGLREKQKPLGGCGIQRMTTDQWLDLIEREAPEIPRPGYRSSFAPQHIGPTGAGNLPRPKERGGCDCPVCTHNQAILDRKASN